MGEIKNYVRFTTANPRLSFSFLYPGDWQARELAETSYDEVTIVGPRNQEDTFSLGVIVRVTPTVEEGGQYAGLEELIADYLAKRSRLAGSQEISRARGYLAGVEATEIEIGYTMPLPLNTLNPKETPIVERRIFFRKGNHFYEVMYTAVEEVYYQYLDSFKDLVRTFEFRDDPARWAYRPLVMPAPAHAIQEDPAEYETDG